MASRAPHFIIYSHGFGVRKTDRGLFTAIADALPDIQSVMFDYNPINEKSNTITVRPLPDQALKLRRVINTVRGEHPGAIIDLVCHSQGCVVAALLKPRHIRKVIMLTPPADMSEAAVVERLGTRKSIDIDVAGRTRLQSSDGGTTVIRPDYWEGLAGINLIKLYDRFARFTNLRIISAKQDELLGDVNFKISNPTISVVNLDGNHNFDSPEDRKRIVYVVQKELASE